MTKTTAAQTTWGIELETEIPNEYRGTFPVGMYHNGTQIPVFPEGWNGQSDCSIEKVPGYFGCEIVSPVLTGEAGLVQVVYVLDFLAQIGAKVNKSTSLTYISDAITLTSSI
jgi:hypothetical protein